MLGSVLWSSFICIKCCSLWAFSPASEGAPESQSICRGDAGGSRLSGWAVLSQTTGTCSATQRHSVVLHTMQGGRVSSSRQKAPVVEQSQVAVIEEGRAAVHASTHAHIPEEGFAHPLSLTWEALALSEALGSLKWLCLCQ